MQVSIGCETFNIPCIECASTLEHCLIDGLGALSLSLSLSLSLYLSALFSRFIHALFTFGQRCVNQLSINCYRLSIRPISDSLQNINHNRNRMKSMTNTINWLNEWPNHYCSLGFNLLCASARAGAYAVDLYGFVSFRLIWFGLVCLSVFALLHISGAVCAYGFFLYFAYTSSNFYEWLNERSTERLCVQVCVPTIHSSHSNHYQIVRHCIILNNVTQSEIYKCFIFVEMFSPIFRIFVTMYYGWIGNVGPSWAMGLLSIFL